MQGEVAERLERHIALPGHRSFPGGLVHDVTGLLAACDLALFSSVLEGLPNGVLEAMAVGLAVGLAAGLRGAAVVTGEPAAPDRVP